MVFADAPPSALTVDQIAQKVEDAQAGAQDVQMDLKMRMQDVLSGQTQEVQGAVKLKNPNLVYAHYLKPNEQFLYINGDLAQMYQPSQNTVYRQKSAGGSGRGADLPGHGTRIKTLYRRLQSLHRSRLGGSGGFCFLSLRPPTLLSIR